MLDKDTVEEIVRNRLKEIDTKAERFLATGRFTEEEARRYRSHALAKLDILRKKLLGLPVRPHRAPALEELLRAAKGLGIFVPDVLGEGPLNEVAITDLDFSAYTPAFRSAVEQYLGGRLDDLAMVRGLDKNTVRYACLKIAMRVVERVTVTPSEMAVVTMLVDGIALPSLLDEPSMSWTPDEVRVGEKVEKALNGRIDDFHWPGRS